jgi:hypothetical protein
MISGCTPGQLYGFSFSLFIANHDNSLCRMVNYFDHGTKIITLPRSNAVVKKGYSYTSTPPMGRAACTEPQCLYKGALYLTF